jgi:hypothetical protein
MQGRRVEGVEDTAAGNGCEEELDKYEALATLTDRGKSFRLSIRRELLIGPMKSSWNSGST